MKIYVIYGTSGEYSDREIWCLGGFYDEDKAKELVENASSEAKRIYALIEEKEKSKPRSRGLSYYTNGHFRIDSTLDELWKAWMLDFTNDPAMNSKYDKDIDTGIYEEASYYYEEIELYE